MNKQFSIGEAMDGQETNVNWANCKSGVIFSPKVCLSGLSYDTRGI